MSSTPVFHSVTKPILVVGCERTPAIIVSGMAAFLAVLAWFSWSLYVLIAAIIIFVCGMAILRMLASRDPIMFQVAQRYYEFNHYYPARTKANEAPSKTKSHIILAIVISATLAIVWIIL